MGKNKKRKRLKQAEGGISPEVKNVMLLQARLAKRKTKPKRLESFKDTPVASKSAVKRKRSNFTSELTDTSRKNAKKLRYDANKHKQGKNVGKKNVGGKKGGKGGKMFGKAQKKK